MDTDPTLQPTAPSSAAPRTASESHRRVTHAVRRIIHAVDLNSHRLAREFDVTAPQLATLDAAVGHRGITAQEIAREVHVSSSTLVGVLDRLEAKGLVERRRDRSDRRRIQIVATPAGRRLAKRAGSPVGHRLSEGLGDLDEGRRETIAEALETVAELLER